VEITPLASHVIVHGRRAEGNTLPFEAVQQKIADYLRKRQFRKAKLSQYLSILASRKPRLKGHHLKLRWAHWYSDGSIAGRSIRKPPESRRGAAMALSGCAWAAVSYSATSLTDMCNFRCTYCLPDGYRKARARRPICPTGRIVRPGPGLCDP